MSETKAETLATGRRYRIKETGSVFTLLDFTGDIVHIIWDGASLPTTRTMGLLTSLTLIDLGQVGAKQQ